MLSHLYCRLSALCLAALIVCVGTAARAQAPRPAHASDVYIAVSPDSSKQTFTKTAGMEVRFTLSARDASGNSIPGWETSGDTAVVRLRNSVAENDTSLHSWSADSLDFSWTSLRVTSGTGAPPRRTGPYEWRIPASAFFSGFLDLALVSTFAETGVLLEAAALHGAGVRRSASITFNAGPVTNYLVEITVQQGWDAVYLMRPFETVVTPRDRYLNRNGAQVATRISARFPAEFTASSAAQFASPYTVRGTRNYLLTPSAARSAGTDELQRITVAAVSDSTIRGVSDGIQILHHPPYPFSLMSPIDGYMDSIRSPNQHVRFSWSRDSIPDPWTDITISRFSGAVSSDTLRYWVVFADSACNAIDTIASAGNGELPWADIDGALLLAVRDRVYGPSPPPGAFLYWYVEASDGIDMTRSSVPPAMPPGACGPRVEVRDATGHAGRYAPAPFVLTPDQSRPNATLFRMDHVGIVPGFPDNLSRDTLHLRWQPSLWQPPDSDRNDPSDSIRYEVNIIIDSLGATSKTLTVSFPSNNDSRDTEIAIPGVEVYRRLFRPDVWPLPDPDTIVMRVNWFVRSYNSVGFTYSDTAGATTRKGFTPTPPLVLSYNRPPEWAPVAIHPTHNAVVGDLTALSRPLDVIWTPSRDRNIDKGFWMDCFKIFDAQRMEWVHDWSGREVDTLTYQWVCVVVRNVPAWKGAPVGTTFVRNTGAVTGLQLMQADLASLLGSMDSTSTIAADSVVLDWRVFVKDFNTAESPFLQKVNFRYETSGMLRPDTAMWSRYGMRPHEFSSPWFRLTLARRRGGSTGVESPVSPSVVTLSQNFPNPFVPGRQGTTIAYALHGSAHVRLEITNALGVTVRSIDEGQRTSGSYTVHWDGRDAAGGVLPAGVYMYSVHVGMQMQARVLCVVR